LVGFKASFSIDDNGSLDADSRQGLIFNQGAIGGVVSEKLQTSLELSASATTVKSGRGVRLKTRGGRGHGAVKFSVQSLGGAKCSLSGSVLKTRGTSNGACQVIAVKAGDSQYLATSSMPLTVNMICPQNP
jgi:hypothetical protein